MDKLTGNKLVDAIARINFEGDITPRSWYKHICYQTKKGETKVDRLAIDILADIVYWYRPFQKRHELTGETLGWHKKFKNDILMRSPEAFADVLNTTPRCIRESMKVLETLGLIKVLLKPLKTEYGTLPNVMYIEIVPEAIAEITYRQDSVQDAETLEKSLLTKWVTSDDEMGNNQLRNREQPVTKSSSRATKSASQSDEIVNLSICRDLLETSSETKEERESIPTQLEAIPPTQNSVLSQTSSSLATKSEILPTDKITVLDQNSAAPLAKVETYQRRFADLRKGGSLPDAEMRDWANLEIGQIVAAYRRSGYILTPSPNDINNDFAAYVGRANCPKGQTPSTGLGYSTILKYEKDPREWQKLIAWVYEWQASKATGKTVDVVADADAQRERERIKNALRQPVFGAKYAV